MVEQWWKDINFLNIIKDVKDMDEGQLTELVSAVRDRRDSLRYDKLKNFRVGDKVKWIHGRGTSKETYEGEVYKVNFKTVAVEQKDRKWCKWRISPSMLTKIEGDES